MARNHAKLSKFKLEYLYSKEKTTAIHSFEAFLSSLDYNKVRHHKEFGALMASLFSIAAYLMSSSPCDNETKAYLHDIVRSGAGQGIEGIASAFPSVYLEITWVLTTLLKNEYSVAEIGTGRPEPLAELLFNVSHNQGGF